MKCLFVIFCFLLTFSPAVHAQLLNINQQQEVQDYVNGLVEDDEPGFAYGVVRDGVVILEGYKGMANLSHLVPIDDHTVFNIASVAKQFTALAVLDLSLQGKLSLNDELSSYLPDYFMEVDEPILIRQLINHSSGVRDFYDLMSIQQRPWWRQEGFDNADALTLLKKQAALNFEPGSAFLYSNSNYTLLAKIVEVVSGRSFHEYMQTLFERLGMQNTKFNRNYMAVISSLALPYADWGDGVWQQYPHMTNLYGDGFLYTTLQDQLRFEVELQLAQKNEHELLIVSQLPISEAHISSYGFGLELEDRNGRAAVHHSGGTGAYHAQVVRYTEEELSIIVMSNNSTIWSGFIADKIADIILPNTIKESVSENTYREKQYTTERTVDELVGEFESPEGSVIRIFENEEGLSWKMDNNNPIQLIGEKGSVFYPSYDKEVKIGFSTKQFTVYNPGEEPRLYKKLNAFEPTEAYLTEFKGSYYNKEIDRSFELSIAKDGTLQLLYPEMSEEKVSVEIIQKDRFLRSDYVLTAGRNQLGEVKEILLSVSRVKNLVFQKMD
jgi:CubicO group peptidase (beta-lactamase class C family)